MHLVVVCVHKGTPRFEKFVLRLDINHLYLL
jgi:hypothetical protein